MLLFEVTIELGIDKSKVEDVVNSHLDLPVTLGQTNN